MRQRRRPPLRRSKSPPRRPSCDNCRAFSKRRAASPPTNRSDVAPTGRGARRRRQRRSRQLRPARRGDRRVSTMRTRVCVSRSWKRNSRRRSQPSGRPRNASACGRAAFRPRARRRSRRGAGCARPRGEAVATLRAASSNPATCRARPTTSRRRSATSCSSSIKPRSRRRSQLFAGVQTARAARRPSPCRSSRRARASRDVNRARAD